MEILAIVLSVVGFIMALCAIVTLNRSVKDLAERVGGASAAPVTPPVYYAPAVAAAPSNDGVLVAAITGALMAYLGDRAPKSGLEIRRIRRVTPNAWANAGRNDQLQNRL